MLQVLYTSVAPFRDEEVFALGRARLDSVRLAKTDACKRPEDKRRSLCGGLLLQYALLGAVRRESGANAAHDTGRIAPGADAAHDVMQMTSAQDGAFAGAQAAGCGKRDTASGSRPLELRYGYGKHGKPYLPDYPQYHFNLSHSGDYAALVFADREAGVDIQCARPFREALARRILTDEEYGSCRGLPTERERQDYFFRRWCARESLGKLTGEGLLCDFTREYPVWKREYMIADHCYMCVCAYREREASLTDPRDVTAELLDFVTQTGKSHIIS